MSKSKFVANNHSPPKLGVGGTGLSRDSSTIQPSALQQKHLQHIVGSGRNSVHGIEEAHNVRANPFNQGSNFQGPQAQKRQNTGQRIIESTSKSIRSTKALPLSSSGHPNSHQTRNQQSYNDYSRAITSGVHSGIPKPQVGSAAQRRSANRLSGNNNQYNSTSAAGYQSKPGGNQNSRGALQNIQMRQKKPPGKDTSHQLKMAGAASLQRERDLNSQSELSQIAQGYKPGTSSNNPSVGSSFAPLQPKKEMSGKNSVNHQASDLNHGLPSTRQLISSSKPYSNQVSSASNNRIVRNISRSQVDSGSGSQGLIRARPGQENQNQQHLASNKMVASSQNGPVNQQFHYQGSSQQTPVGSMPLAQAIYGQQSSNHNRNYRGNKSKHAEAKNSIQSKRSNAGVPTGNGGSSSTQGVAEYQRMQQFKNNMREIQNNVKRTEEVLSIISQNQSRNAGANSVKSPQVRRDTVATSNNNLIQRASDLTETSQTGATLASVNTINTLNAGAPGGLQGNSGISRSRVKGLQNSHSNKRLPTWKAQNSLLASDKGISSPVFERGGIADRSLDRVTANSKGNLISGGGGIILQSRAELLQNEYKKVIENHPGTIAGAGVTKYDDTDFLSRMFSKNPNEASERPLGLNKQDSSEVLHKSQSVKMIRGEPGTSSQTIGGAPSTLAPGQGSVAARMLARKANILQQSSDHQRENSVEVAKGNKYGGSKESRKLTNRDGNITSSRNQKSQVSNASQDSAMKGGISSAQVAAISEFKPMGDLDPEVDDMLANDDDIRKITRLQLINASARFELLSANQQLIDFHLNRVMKTMFKRQQAKQDQESKKDVREGQDGLSNLMNIEKSVIQEASEADENNTTHLKIGHHFGNSRLEATGGKNPPREAYNDTDRKPEVPAKIALQLSDIDKDRNRDSMFGTMLLTNGMSKEHEARMIQMQDPHLVMQQRLNDMHPMMFGDTMRLPVLKPDFPKVQQQQQEK